MSEPTPYGVLEVVDDGGPDDEDAADIRAMCRQLDRIHLELIARLNADQK